MSKKKLRSYTPEFKQSAIKLVQEQGYTHAAAATRLGISLHTLQYWLRHTCDQHPESLPSEVVSQADELKKLRKDNQRLQMEIEILKKAAAYFAKESL
jgi:Transposase and inactivated derivatives